MNEEMREPIAKIGDIIQIRGYGNRKYEVFSLQYAKDVFPTEMFIDICYDAVSLDGEDFIFAYQEDITVVQTPANVDYKRLEYLSEKSVNMNTDIMDDLLKGFEIVPDDAAENITAKETEEDEVEANKEDDKPKNVDDLLDELIDYQELIRIVGEDYEDGDGYYRRKVDECMAKLAKMTGGNK